MALPGREQFRAIVLRYVEVPGASALHAVGFTPNSITVLGFAVSLAAAAVVGSGFLLVGGIVFLLGSVMDLMDGALARLTGRVTKFGALLDSVMDRLGEAALFLGMAIHGLRADLSDGRLLFFMTVLILALITSQTVSYLRARGESLGIDTRTGLMTRPERVVLLSLGLIIGLRALEVVLIIIAAVSFFTLLQRLFHIRKLLMEPVE
jgi:CDP-diacylglycerol--glycerol-3-phosphate 3-phosphatidyltransferase